MEKNKAEIKGYSLSTDYKRLWDLIQDGNRVPAWIVYSKKFDPNDPIYDLVEVKLAYMSDRYSIGVRGHGYETLEKTFEAFEMNCKSLELRFIEQSADYHSGYLQGLKDKEFELSNK